MMTYSTISGNSYYTNSQAPICFNGISEPAKFFCGLLSHNISGTAIIQSDFSKISHAPYYTYKSHGIRTYGMWLNDIKLSGQ